MTVNELIGLLKSLELHGHGDKPVMLYNPMDYGYSNLRTATVIEGKLNHEHFYDMEQLKGGGWAGRPKFKEPVQSAVMAQETITIIGLR